MRKAYIVCGSPGSGKTSYAEKLCDRRSAVLIDIDTVSEGLVRAGLTASGHNPDDRDSEYFKRVYREAIYKTLFDIARSNLSRNDVVIVGPFTKEIRDPKWPETLEESLGAPVEVHYLWCSPDIQRERLRRRGELRDLAKLQNWEQYRRYFGEDTRPVFPHSFVDTSDLLAPTNTSFLTARWESLAMLNYEIDPAILEGYLPRGTELDTYEGKHFVSMVGFMFRNTKIAGFPIPFHRNFEEINLRFYVRRIHDNECRRGVVFIKEIVQRAAVAMGARLLYRENYIVLPTSHEIEDLSEASNHTSRVSYQWRYRDSPNALTLRARGRAQEIPSGSFEEFISVRHWGYTRVSNEKSLEYKVEHPRWRIRQADSAQLQCDVEALYGKHFAGYVGPNPHSAFLAEGSDVKVHWRMKVT